MNLRGPKRPWLVKGVSVGTITPVAHWGMDVIQPAKTLHI